MNFEFRLLKVEHLNDVLEIEQLCFQNPWNRRMFEQEILLPVSHFFVAKHDNKILGYGGYWQIENESHIVNIAVHPNFRRNGLGRKILHYMIGQMDKKNSMKILLEVRKSNYPAIKLYESEGFKITGVRPKYYCNEDAILMERLLS